ncbi:MAG: acyltransferase [Candidatus Azobacteroides sp.]|nr:acyltransferase [Candidatus Azobacteroides sp.]
MAKLNELELQSKTIDWLRFPLAIFVIFIHMNPKVDIQSIDYLNLNLNSWYVIIGTLISKVIGLIAVPCFFMFSGYLFFNNNKMKKWNMTIYFAKVKTRLQTLVVPYILFNLSAIILSALPKILKADGSIYPFLSKLFENWYRIFWNYTSWSAGNSNMIGLPLQPNFGPFVLHLWFLRDLIIMVFISPIVYYMVKHTKIWGLIILGLFYYTKIWVEIPGYSARLFLTAFFFFSIGAFFSINRKNIVVSLRKYQIIWLIISLITMILNTYFYGTIHSKFFSPVFILSGVISAVNITSYFMEHGKLQVRETLSKASFFIYCAHGILILGFTYRAFMKILGTNNTLSLLITYFTVPFVCAGIILCIYRLMKRFTPRLLSLFTGNR